MAKEPTVFTNASEVAALAHAILASASPAKVLDNETVGVPVPEGQLPLVMDIVFTQMEGVKNVSYNQTTGLLEASIDPAKQLDAQQVALTFQSTLQNAGASTIASEVNTMRDTREKFNATPGMGNAMNEDTVNAMYQASMQRAADMINKPKSRGHGPH